MYLGEVLRLVLLKLAEEAAFFGDTIPPKLKTPFTLRYASVCCDFPSTSVRYLVPSSIVYLESQELLETCLVIQIF